MENSAVLRQSVGTSTCSALLVLLLLISSATSYAASVCPAPPTELLATAQRAEDAFALMNGPGFDEARATLIEQLGCLSGPPNPQQAAAVHRVEALAAFRAKDAPGTLAALQAMHASDPTSSLTEELAPAGGPLSRKDAEARALPPAPRAPHGVSLKVYVDGRVASDLPTTRASLVAVVGSDDQVQWSGLVPAGGSIPKLLIADTPIIGTGSTTSTGDNGPMGVPLPPVEAPPPRKPARPVFIAAGGSALAAGALGVLYLPAKEKLETAGSLIATEGSPAAWEEAFGAVLSKEEVYALHDRARGLEIGAQVAGGLALGLGAVGVGLVLVW